MSVYQVDPLTDARWSQFLDHEAQASVFHTPSWLKALEATYGYEPVVLTTTRPDQPLTNGIVFCRIRSWLTGARLVSLPFSDHCQPLVSDSSDLLELLNSTQDNHGSKKWKYVELRPLSIFEPHLEVGTCLTKSESFCFHRLDLQRSVEEICHAFHRKSVRQMVQRAEREGLTMEQGQSDELLKNFYGLLLLTRQRHQLPPQPLSWFRNLLASFGKAAVIMVSYKDGRPTAGVITLTHQKSVVYKYGCSDARFHNLGGMQFLLWNAIRDAKARAAEEFDFGRSDLDNAGLISFKDNWGASRSRIDYYRYPAASTRKQALRVPIESARKVFSLLPGSCLIAAGRLLYRHIG
jgi:hypothetical protein